MWKSAIALGCAIAACRGDQGESTTTGSAGSAVVEAVAKIVATSAETTGTVEIRRKGEARWEKVEVGGAFRERDWVRTGPRSFARLRFATGGYMDLGENTTVLVDSSFTIEQGTVVGFTEGKDKLTVKAADGSEAAIASAGPAEFRLTPGDQGLEVAVTKGSVELALPDGKHTIAAGEAATIAHHRVGDASKLLAFPKSISPGVDARFLFKPSMTIPLVWSHVPDSKGYYLQIARDTEFHNLVSTAALADAKGSFAPDAVGVYAWRVAARDASGRLGEFGFARRIYCEHEQPTELLLGPRDNFKLDYANTPPTVEFSWQPLGDIKKYKLVIERDAPGSEPIATTTTGGQVISQTLEDGVYYWGVYAINGDREDPIFLTLRQLTIHKLEGPKIHHEVKWGK